jgi:hypothetical protein
MKLTELKSLYDRLDEDGVIDGFDCYSPLSVLLSHVEDLLAIGIEAERLNELMIFNSAVHPSDFNELDKMLGGLDE